MSPFGRNIFPSLPASLSVHNDEIDEYYAAQMAAHPRTGQAPYLTPYLGLRARLSQIWINRWTVLLFLILVRILIAISSLDSGIESTRREALSVCTSVESMGSTMASMPHYMSTGVNQMTAKGVESAIDGLTSMLELTVTGVEEMVVFVINMLTQTYICLITLAIRGSLDTVIGAAKEITDFLDDALGEIADAIQDGADDLEDGVNKLVDGLNSIPQLFGSDSEIPTLDIADDLEKLDNLELPSSIEETLNKLNASVPTFEEVNNATNAAIRFPFEQVKQLIRETTGEGRLDISALPVPAREELNFCSDAGGINDFFDSLEDLASTARRIAIGVIVTLALLVCIPMAYREIKRWRLMQRRAQLISNKAYDPNDVVYIASRPTSSTIGIKLANRFSSLRTQTLVRWAVAYSTSTPALFVLSLGITGLLACLCQFILLKSVEGQAPALTEQVSAFAEKVVTSLDSSSQQWALGMNDAIRSTSDELNEEIFGWVQTSSTGLNDTLNTFVDTTMTQLNDTFGDTPLYEPITDVLNCLILLKIEGIQKGLTWVQENAKISFPELAADTFSLGAVASLAGDDSDFGQTTNSFLANPSSVASDEISSAVARLTDRIASGIRKEAIISTVILLVWLLVAIIGIARSTTLFFSRDKSRAEGGGQTYAADPMTENARGFDATGLPSYDATTKGTRNDNGSNPSLILNPENTYAAGYPSNTINPSRNPNALSVVNISHSASNASSASSTSALTARSDILPPSATIPAFNIINAAGPSAAAQNTTGQTSDSAYPPEKVRNVGAHRVDTAVTQPRLLRASSYGNVAATSPVGTGPRLGGGAAANALPASEWLAGRGDEKANPFL